MEVKEWSYEEYPSFDEPIDGVDRLLFPEQEILQIVMKLILVWFMYRGQRG